MINSWLPMPLNLTLSTDEVHIFLAHLDVTTAQLPQLAQTLSSDEQARAERFYFEQHRHRYIAGRGILRTILGRYLGIEPEKVQFAYSSRGKPMLVWSQFSFNLSHSENLALYAVTRDRLVGVDIEYMRPMSDLEQLAKRFFLPTESAVLRSLPPQQQTKTFFRYWTCKEAYLKATGDGLSQLEQIEVSLTPEAPARLQTSVDWSLTEIVPADNYLAAVAVAGTGCHLQYWQYS
jgi:4'-phosphopantetheinyl transferase